MFIFKEINLDDPIMQKVYRFRCEVLCEELKFFNLKKYPDKKEIDFYDNYSDHFVALDKKGELIAYVRMIYNSEKGFPLENNMKIYDEYKNLPKNDITEISRLFIKKEYRGYKSSIEIIDGFLKTFIFKRLKERKIKYVYATLQRNFLRLLKALNIHFKIIGPEQIYGGKRFPTLLAIKDLKKYREDFKNLKIGDEK